MSYPDLINHVSSRGRHHLRSLASVFVFYRRALPVSPFNRLWGMIKAPKYLKFGPIEVEFRFWRTRKITKLKDKPVSDLTSWLTNRRSLRNCRNPSGRVAVVVGVGPGLGDALAELLSGHGFELALLTRDASRLTQFREQCLKLGGKVRVYGIDTTREQNVSRAFKEIERTQGSPELVIYTVQAFVPGEAISVESAAFEWCWKHNCLGAFLVAKAASKLMVKRKRGTIIFVGSTSSILGRAGHVNLSIGKFGQRALAQVLARELWPKGVHVSHLIIDADIAEHDGDVSEPQVQANPYDVAKTIMFIHSQPNTAWSSEVDVRPSQERFWEHC